MPQRPLRVLLVGALLVAGGVHLPVLQSWAWASMALKSLRTATSFEAGRPCAMCLKVRQGAQSSQRSLAGPSEGKTDFFCLARAHAASTARPLWAVAQPDAVPRRLARLVNLPPPRALQA